MAPLVATLVGRVDSAEFQKGYECVEYVHSERPDEYELTTLQLFPHQWEQQLQSIREKAPPEHADRLGAAEIDCLVYTPDFSSVWVNGEFVKMVSLKTRFRVFHFPPDSDDPEAYHNTARIRYNSLLKATGHSFCFLVFKIGGEVQRPVVLELFSNVCPRSCENFRHLCLGDLPPVEDAEETGVDQIVRLYYKSSHIFRIVKDGWIQGGDIVHDKGNGGYSCYGRSFPDESFDLKHESEGILGMANTGRDTNSSQFYITVGSSGHRWMDGKYVAIGRVVEGMSVLRAIHDIPVKHSQVPETEVTVDDCGEIDLDKY